MLTHRATRRSVLKSGTALLTSSMVGARPASVLSHLAATLPSTTLTGHVIWPDDAAYEAARRDFNLRFSRFPAAIVVCGSVAEVQTAVRYARQRKLPLRARSGGHSYEAYSVVDGGLVIDVSGLNQVVVDTAAGAARVGAGVRLGDLSHRLADAGVTIPGGTCPGVGIAGLALGGGVGYLSRQFGLTCDNLLAIDLVTADGQTLRASAEEHPDLFWALRGGGGGNFGIATAFTFRVHPITQVSLFTVTWPWDDAPQILDAWQRWAPSVDSRLTCGLTIGPPSDGTITATGQFTGTTSALPPLLAPLLGAGSPGPPQIWSATLLDAASFFAGPGASHSRFKNSSAMVYQPLPSAAITTLVDRLRAAPGAHDLIGFFPLGGAVSAIAPHATAFPHRRALFDLQYQAYWSADADEAANIAWVRQTRVALLPYTQGAYVNYIDADIPDWATAYYGDNLARLVRVKGMYDPDNVFAAPQAIPGAYGKGERANAGIGHE